MLPFIKPPAAERLSAMEAASTATAVTSEQREPHSRAEGRRRLARRGPGLCTRGMQARKSNTALLGPGNSGGLASWCPDRLGWHGTLGDGRDLTAELVEKVGAFQFPCAVALSC